MRRIQFFSTRDFASGHYLKELENRFTEIDKKESLDINDHIELYNAKLYLDHEMYLNTWDEKKRKEIKDKAENDWNNVKKAFLTTVNSESLFNLFEQLDFHYRNHFWEIIDQLKVYKAISNDALLKVLESKPKEIKNILKQPRIVTAFSTTIRDFLLTHPDCAELLLETEQSEDKNQKLNFPKSLTHGDKEKIICDYLDLEKPNLNFVSLIEFAKDSPELKLSNKTRLKAKRTHNKLSELFFNSNLATTQVYGIDISTVEEQEKEVLYRYEDNILKISYNYSFLKSLLDAEDLAMLFHDLFHFTDEQGLFTLISKESESSTLESIFMRSQNEYHISMAFRRKDMLSLYQIFLLQTLLEKEQRSFSKIIDKHLSKLSAVDHELKKLYFNLPSENLKDEEKIRIIAPSLESLLSQYQLYVNDGEIDFELLSISSKPISFSGLNSNVPTKYIYPNLDTEIGNLFHLFFSDQSMLHYIEPYEDKYDNFYLLLANENNIPFESFEEYMKPQINKLIEEGHLYIDNHNFLRIKNEIKLFVYYKLHENGVINYWHFPPQFRKELDILVHEGLCYTESTLFTKSEVTYLNYYLNKKEFTNGPDLRNKYLHGANIPNDESSNMDYLAYLRIVILCLLKIEDDLILIEEAKDTI
ncbi:hypothetical protein ACFX5U_12540 [Sphingobacterium sp. SG20118]|uniref:hypothetical protein n=1 Tax=Sphingobacterium sp. SG20118 TaxID=3367156 RepID=UPI0037DFC689